MCVGIWVLEWSEMKVLYIDVKLFNILTQSCHAVRKHSFQKSIPLFQREVLKIQNQVFIYGSINSSHIVLWLCLISHM